MKKLSQLSVTVSIILGVLMAMPSKGQVLTSITDLTGGDAGEGYSPLAVDVKAFDFDTGAVAIQGISFAAGTLGTRENGASGGAANESGTITASSLGFGSTANDNAMVTLLQGFQYVGGGTVYNFTPTGAFAQLQFTGLTLGQTYQVDVFTVADTGSRDTNVQIIGSASQDNTVLTTITAQDIQYTLTPDASGDITLDTTATAAVARSPRIKDL